MLLNHRYQLSFFLCLCFLAKAISSKNITCHEQDFTALLGFLDGLESGIQGWGNDTDANCCAWDGVTCEFVSKVSNISRVVSLELPDRRLAGKLNKSLAGLNYLRVLDLSNNFFSHYLPHELFRFEFLEVLDLSSNGFIGNLPVEISLPSLKLLDLSQNSLQCLLNTDLCGAGSRLQVLDLAMNYFTEKILRTIGNCSFLEVLSLGSNLFEGNLPNGLFQLPNLRQLSAQNNLFAGLLSPSFGNLSNAVDIDISSNGFFGTLPDVFHNLQKLRRFSASSNRFIGSLPPSLSTSPSISAINVRNNSLSGSIELNCSAMVNLTSLALGSNLFSGPISGNLPSCRKLILLDLSGIRFSRQIPESFKNLSSLSHLSLSNCSLVNLRASLDILQHCKNLSFLILTLNFQGEKVPTDLNLKFNSLSTFVLAGCQLTGLIPNLLQGCPNLQHLDLSWNQFSGSIPSIFSKMKLLYYLDLSNNMLSEGIPTSLTKMESFIDQNITLDEHSEDLSLFSEGKSTNQVPRFSITTLDLSSNYLTGPILPELGNLKELQVLNLFNNSLSGHIPETLSNIRTLELLDLSYNSLVGTIPPSFTKLSLLSNFNVSFNKLSGHVPSGGQFDTFPTSSFEGNIDLLGCGSSCSSVSNEKPRNDRVEVSDREDSFIGLPFVIGSVTAFMLVVSISYHSGWLFPKKEKKRVEIAWRRIR